MEAPCSGTGSGGASASSSVTTLGSSQTLGSLTAAQDTQLCNDTFAYYGQAVSQATLCKSAGLTYAVSSSAPTDSKFQQNCTSRESSCLNAGAASPSCSTIPASCTVTVAQYSACITDTATAFNSGVDGLASCATATLSDEAAIWDFVTANPPDSCAPLAALCATVDIPTPQPGTAVRGGPEAVAEAPGPEVRRRVGAAAVAAPELAPPVARRWWQRDRAVRWRGWQERGRTDGRHRRFGRGRRQYRSRWLERLDQRKRSAR